MSKYYVYVIINKINSKLYVGKTNNPAVRWQDHRKFALGGKERYPDDFFAVHAALHKYGLDNFEFQIIDEFSEESEAYKTETQYINDETIRNIIKRTSWNHI